MSPIPEEKSSGQNGRQRLNEYKNICCLTMSLRRPDLSAYGGGGQAAHLLNNKINLHLTNVRAIFGYGKRKRYKKHYSSKRA